MEYVKDILLDEDGDLQIAKGNFVIAESDTTHIENIMKAAPGHYKQFPIIGANTISQINGNIGAEFRRNLTINLEIDNYNVKDITIDNGYISIDAERSV